MSELNQSTQVSAAAKNPPRKSAARSALALFLLSCLIGCAAGATAWHFTPPHYESTGMIHLKPDIAPAPDPTELQTFAVLLTSQRVADMAASSENWIKTIGDQHRDPADFVNNLRVETMFDTNMVEATYSDATPEIAQAGAHSVFDAFNSLYLSASKESVTVELRQLEGLRDGYVAKIQDYHKEIEQLTDGLGLDAVRASYAAKIQLFVAAQSEYDAARRDLEMAEKPAPAPETTTAPAVSVPGLRTRVDLVSRQLEDAAKDVRARAEIISSAASIDLDTEKVRQWLAGVKERIERINVESNSPSHISVISVGDRAVLVNRQRIRSAAAAGSSAFIGLFGIGMLTLALRKR